MRTHRATRATIIGLCLALHTGGALGGGTHNTSREQVVRALSGFERQPDDAEVRAWGPGAARLLMDVADDASAPAFVRARAASALRVYAGALPVRDFLRRFAAGAGDADVLRRAALDALIRGFGDVATVARYLRDPRVEVRDGAAWALARARTPAARAAIRDALRTESDVAVREVLERGLQ